MSDGTKEAENGGGNDSGRYPLDDPPITDPVCMTICMMQQQTGGGGGGGGGGGVQSNHGGGAIIYGDPSSGTVLEIGYGPNSEPHIANSLGVLRNTTLPPPAKLAEFFAALRSHNSGDPADFGNLGDLGGLGDLFVDVGIMPLISRMGTNFTVKGWAHITYSGGTDLGKRFTLELAKMFVFNCRCSTTKGLSISSYDQCVASCRIN